MLVKGAPENQTIVLTVDITSMLNLWQIYYLRRHHPTHNQYQ